MGWRDFGKQMLASSLLGFSLPVCNCQGSSRILQKTKRSEGQQLERMKSANSWHTQYHKYKSRSYRMLERNGFRDAQWTPQKQQQKMHGSMKRTLLVQALRLRTHRETNLVMSVFTSKTLSWRGKTLDDKQKFVAFSRVEGLLLMQFSLQDKGDGCYRESFHTCRFRKRHSNAPKCANSINLRVCIFYAF